MAMPFSKSSLVSIVTILICAGLLFAGNGLFQTLLPIRAGQEDYATALIGMLGADVYVCSDFRSARGKLSGRT